MKSVMPINMLLSNFSEKARTISKIPISISETAKLILKNGKLIGNKSKKKHTTLTINTE